LFITSDPLNEKSQFGPNFGTKIEDDGAEDGQLDI
jgi:hypothetical protein